MLLRDLLIESCKPGEAWHATFDAEPITLFRPWSHFGSFHAASERMYNLHKGDSGRGADNCIFHRVNIAFRNPMQIVDDGGNAQNRILWDVLRNYENVHGNPRKTPVSKTLYDALYRIRSNIATNTVYCTKLVINNGIDGFWYINKFEDEGSTSYINLLPLSAVETKVVPMQHILDEFD